MATLKLHFLASATFKVPTQQKGHHLIKSVERDYQRMVLLIHAMKSFIPQATFVIFSMCCYLEEAPREKKGFLQLIIS